MKLPLVMYITLDPCDYQEYALRTSLYKTRSSLTVNWRKLSQEQIFGRMVGAPMKAGWRS